MDEKLKVLTVAQGKMLALTEIAPTEHKRFMAAMKIIEIMLQKEKIYIALIGNLKGNETTEEHY